MFAILEDPADGHRRWVARSSLGGKSYAAWFEDDAPPIFYADPRNAERDAALFRMGAARQRRITYTVVELEKWDEWREAVDQEEGYPVPARSDARSAHR